MKRVTVHEAKTHLSALLRDVVEGEEIIIARGSVPIARIVPIEDAQNARKPGGARKAIVAIADDFDAPVEDFDGYAP